jgi:hypothetical protein
VPPARLAPAPIQRAEEEGGGATGTVTGLTESEPEEQLEERLDFARVADKLWPHLRRRLRVERERERGLPY